MPTNIRTAAHPVVGQTPGYMVMLKCRKIL
jgi:NAD/NADP transhydrogenase beta subunit